MSSTTLTRPSTAPPRASPRARRSDVRQLHTHAGLYDPTALPSESGRTQRSAPDAIIVPATRPASTLQHLINLAALVKTELVVLCSGSADTAQVTDRMERQLGTRGIVARIDEPPADDQPRVAPAFGTSDAQFAAASGGRRSNLSRKRNLGLLLARLQGWSKVLFVDDDMTIGAADVTRITRLLDRSPIAGMRSLEFPDNSVVCHARRLAQLPQDVFVSGAVLGVNTAGRDLPFFPDVYNEDWFFFGEAAASHRLPKPCAARQAPYDPFGSPDRARHEEFGDVLAEGLYSLIESSGLDSFERVAERATEQFWTRFISVRQEGIYNVRCRLRQFQETRATSDNVDDAIASLGASATQYAGSHPAITPDVCAGFLEAWRKDTADWRNDLPEPLRGARPEDAMEWLEIADWRPVR